MLFSICGKKNHKWNNIMSHYILLPADSMRTSQCSPQEGRRYEAFGRLRREDGTASSGRHVNKPASLSKYGVGN